MNFLMGKTQKKQKQWQKLVSMGEKLRLRTAQKGESCVGRDYKAICVDKQKRKAWFAQNQDLITWVNRQSSSEELTCLGDGHPGIWKLVKEFKCEGKKREILDWYHLVENLNKIKGSIKRRKKAERLLWEGKVNQTIELISPLKTKQAQNFCTY